MIEFDYIEEANKLKKKRDFGKKNGFDFFYDSSYITKNEEKFYEICKKDFNCDLEIYQDFINQILDKLEKDIFTNKIKDEDDLSFKYRYYLGKLCNYFTSGFHHKLLDKPKVPLSFLESIL